MNKLLLVFAVTAILSHSAIAGYSVPTYFAKKYVGQVVLDGQCAAGVQKIFADYTGGQWVLGSTSSWRQGAKVLDNYIPEGTAIASFVGGTYQPSIGGHAAIYVGQNSEGIQVYDQWSGQPFHARTLRKNYQGPNPQSNKADRFYVIERQ